MSTILPRVTPRRELPTEIAPVALSAIGARPRT